MEIKKRSDGISVVEHEGMKFTIFIPSRKRMVEITRHPLLRFANVIVHEEEYDGYSKYFTGKSNAPATILTHKLFGLPKIRNAMLDYFHPDEGEEFQIQSDDDVLGLRHTMVRRVDDRRTAEEILNVCVSEAVTAIDLPTGLFFFQQSPRPQERSSLEPFVLRRWGRTDLFGVTDPDMRFDERLLDCEDLDLSLQCIAKHRMLWMDMRFFVITSDPEGRGGNSVGGSAGVSTTETIKSSYKYLARKWGSAVVRIGMGVKRGNGYAISISIPQSYDDMKKLLSENKSRTEKILKAARK